jgi:hypothetical protein
MMRKMRSERGRRAREGSEQGLFKPCLGAKANVANVANVIGTRNCGGKTKLKILFSYVPGGRMRKMRSERGRRAREGSEGRCGKCYW